MKSRKPRLRRSARASRTLSTPLGTAAAAPGTGRSMATLSVLWRIAVAGVCFLAFMIGGIALTLLLFPVMRLLPGGRSEYERRVRLVVCLSFATLLGVLRL